MSKTQTNVLKRDPAVELARLIGCLIVVGIHCWSGTSAEYADDFSHNLVSCILADGVAIFWMISGCFLFRSYSFRKTMKRTAKGIILPGAVMSLLMFFIGGDLLYGTFTFSGIFQKGDEIRSAMQSLLRWENPVSSCNHFWYLYIYILVMILSPAIYGLVRWLEEDTRREAWFLALSLGLFILNDVTGNEYWAFSQYRLNGAFPAAVEMVWGSILYRHREQLAGRKRWPLYAGGFLALDILRTYIQMARYQNGSGNSSILYWYSSIGLLCAACVLLGCLSLIGDQRIGLPDDGRNHFTPEPEPAPSACAGLSGKKNESAGAGEKPSSHKDENSTIREGRIRPEETTGYRAAPVNRLICAAASYTFTIYLIHTVVKRSLTNLGVLSVVSSAVAVILTEGTALYELLCLIVSAALVAAISLAFAILLRAVCSAAGRLLTTRKQL